MLEMGRGQGGCYAIVFPGRKSAFHARFWPAATGEAPKSGLRPAEGRPEGRFWCLPGGSPAKIWPGSSIYGPEALLRNRVCFFSQAARGSKWVRRRRANCAELGLPAHRWRFYFNPACRPPCIFSHTPAVVVRPPIASLEHMSRFIICTMLAAITWHVHKTGM